MNNVMIGRKGSKVHAPKQSSDTPTPLCATGTGGYGAIQHNTSAFKRFTSRPVTCKICQQMLSEGRTERVIVERFANDD